MMTTDDLARRPARLAFKVRFKINGSRTTATLPMQGRWFESPQLHQEVCANWRDFLRSEIARHFRSLRAE